MFTGHPTKDAEGGGGGGGSTDVPVTSLFFQCSLLVIQACIFCFFICMFNTTLIKSDLGDYDFRKLLQIECDELNQM